MFSKLFGCVLVLFALFGCGGAKGKADAERAVVEFHQRLDRGEFATIYADAHPDFRTASSEPDFVAFVGAVHRKLGNVKSTEQVSWKIGSFNLKTEVMLAYKTTFDSGSGMETFNFRIDGGHAILRGYNINSKELVLK
jgi:hypothetical protein